MSKPVFITFRDTLLDVNDISYARVCHSRTYFDDDNPWTMTISFKGANDYLWFHFETLEKAQEAHQYFRQLVTDALTEMR